MESARVNPSSAANHVVGESLLHPAAIAAAVVMLVNDHVLKAHCPCALTGKLSDFAGLTFFPLLLLTLTDAWVRLLGARSGPTHRALAVCVVVTGLAFGAVKTTHAGAQAFRRELAVLQWPARAMAAQRVVPLGRVSFTQDPTDLAALPALAIAYWAGRKVVYRGNATRPSRRTHSAGAER